jgi:hypothetical protein
MSIPLMGWEEIGLLDVAIKLVDPSGMHGCPIGLTPPPTPSPGEEGFMYWGFLFALFEHDVSPADLNKLKQEYTIVDVVSERMIFLAIKDQEALPYIVYSNRLRDVVTSLATFLTEESWFSLGTMETHLKLGTQIERLSERKDCRLWMVMDLKQRCAVRIMSIHERTVFAHGHASRMPSNLRQYLVNDDQATACQQIEDTGRVKRKRSPCPE